MSRPVNPWKFTGYKPGQNIQCKIVSIESDGYVVDVKKDKEVLPGFLKTPASLRIGEEVLGQYMGVQNGRILLTALFAQSSTSRVQTTATPEVKQVSSWQDQLKDFDNYYKEVSETQDLDSLPIVTKQIEYNFRRAIDYIMPPFDQNDITTYSLQEFEMELFIGDLEGGMRTGCVKIICEEQLSRSAILLYKGRVYGAIYSSKEVPQTPDWEEAIPLVLNDLFLSSSEISVYDLPENIVLPLSACFQGFHAPSSEDNDTSYNLDYYSNWFASKESTGLFAITFNAIGATFLIYIFKGQMKGSYLVEEKQYYPDLNYLNELLVNYPDSTFQASAVSPSLLLNPNRHGISLSMALRSRKL